MFKDLIENFKNKKILILGFGKEGKSTYELIRKYLPKQYIYISDQRDIQNIKELKEDENVEIISNDCYLKQLEEYDIIMKSPGISFNGLNIEKFSHKIKSQLELLLEFLNNYTIGVTGTKGKSTTSTLIYEVLKGNGKDCLLLGNIGIPVFDYIDKIKEDTILVLEMSSHQLEYMALSPNIAILLNLFEEHLDHYESYEKYIEAKCNIYKYQKESDYFLYNLDNETVKKHIKNTYAKTYKVSLKSDKNSDVYIKNNNIYVEDENMYDISNHRNLKGDYNLNNIMFVVAVAQILKLDKQKTADIINNFKTLAHRLELVATIDGVDYYDNSIATVPIATIEAVKALKNVKTLIIGGMDRGIDYTEFIDFLNNSDINNIICMPKTGHDIAKSLKDEKKHVVQTMEEAVKVAKNVTKKGETCLLSPAAASYGFFKNFEAKGDLYKKLINQNKIT